jgi:predicted nucleotidyltransferase component of viral defense system
MIEPGLLKNYFPEYLNNSPSLQKYMIKEYLQLLILDYLTTTSFIRKIVFIGGTNLRLIKGIDRFSEDLDFDCKNLSKDEFIAMTDGIKNFLMRNGYRVETRDKENLKLKAFRRNFYFPEMLFDLGLSAHKNERFLIKVESEDQEIEYEHKLAIIKGCGFFFSFPAPTDQVLCAMKNSALLSRQKGRDFYDTMFLMGQTQPDYNFLNAKCGIGNLQELKEAFSILLAKTDLKHKAKDFEHLVFEKRNSAKILLFEEFVKSL